VDARVDQVIEARGCSPPVSTRSTVWTASRTSGDARAYAARTGPPAV